MHQRLDASPEASLDALASAGRCVSRVIEADAAWRLGDRELVAGVSAAYRLVTQAHTAALVLLGELDRRGLAVAAGAPSTQAWLAAGQRMRPQEAKRDVTLAALIGRAGASAMEATGSDEAEEASRYPDAADSEAVDRDGTDEAGAAGEGVAVRRGLSAGDLTIDQAGCVTTALSELPLDASTSTRVLAERLLVDAAALHGPAALTRLGHRILERVDPEAADRRIAEQLAREEREALRLRSATRFSDGHGSVFYKLRLPIADDALLWPVLDTLAAPCPSRPCSDPDGVTDRGATDFSAGDLGAAMAASRFGDPADAGSIPTPGGPDLRSPQQRLADAFVEVFRRVQLDGGLPSSGGDRPRVLVAIGWEQLRDGKGCGRLVDTGDQLSVDAVRRLCCDAQVIPIVLGGKGQVLDVGRARRTFDGPLRLAVIARDGGCAHPGCDRPPRWCDVHHVVPWWAGGGTSLDNGVLLCGFHHRLYDQGTWTLRFGAGGIPESVPPTWVDALRRPRRHERFYERRRHPD